MLNKKAVMNLSFVDSSLDQFVKELEHYIDTSTKAHVVTANPEIIMYGEKDPSYKKILEQAEFMTPDGIGVVIASKILGDHLQERIAGFDVMERLLQLSSEKQYKLYFIGASQDVIETAVGNMKRKYPSLSVVGYHNGYFDWDDNVLVETIAESKPDIIFVGLGFPKQEQWISKSIDSFNKGIFIGVGGSFDVWAGKVKRAPIVWQKLNIEWLYRLVNQPTRWRRMLVLPQFLIKIIGIRMLKK
ncbi:WecB/TagA/CpsF family glycosyltransferase [Litchfieldia alkalitelluris]|uniref:WecB/TagA/CpsF family glycosyltransferase n=1 Tax=Litchfieldia alkalitelluris TaxID=304268 RepID=UPI0009969A75|nr:WecB/TagA/CpsF family glycosyltransferase [Litchfieldia alkalitelluris]